MPYSRITVNALRIEQRRDIPIYTFGINGRLVYQLAAVNYARRNTAGVLTGYQRPAVTSHIKEILDYVSGDDALLPNAIVVAFDERVTFTVLPGMQLAEWGTFGKLEIPIPGNASETKAGWIVDGQQRVTALAELDVKKSFPVVVVAFQTSSQEFQREQFLLVNKTKPLPRDLVNEILPDLPRTRLPRSLERRQLASKVLQILRFDPNSPFFRRVRGLEDVDEGDNISQASILSVVQNSIKRRGLLYDFFDAGAKKHDIEGMARVLRVFYEGVRRTWPSAWSESPRTSRLVHGVGIVALGHLMERVMQGVDPNSSRASSVVENRLERIKDRCAWTAGRWPGLGCAWNELQNTSQDKARLTDHLLREYRDQS